MTAAAAPFLHCSSCGSPRLRAQSYREFVCDVCGYRHFVTAIPAAVALVRNAEGQLLVTRRAHEPGLGKLGLPGGVIESDETAEQAASREVAEEVGLQIPAARFRYLVSLPNRYLFQGFAWPTIDLFYVAEIDSFDAVRLDRTEVAEWMALPLAEIPLTEFAFASNADALRRLGQLGS